MRAAVSGGDSIDLRKRIGVLKRICVKISIVIQTPPANADNFLDKSQDMIASFVQTEMSKKCFITYFEINYEESNFKHNILSRDYNVKISVCSNGITCVAFLNLMKNRNHNEMPIIDLPYGQQKLKGLLDYRGAFI